MQEKKDHNRSADRKEEDSIVIKVAWYSLFINVFLVAVKLYLAGISGSLALQADAIHSLIDVLASAALIAGIWLSGLKSKQYPYGLYKIENVVSLVISLLVFLTAWEIFTEAVTGESAAQDFSGWVLFAVAALTLVPYLLGRYEVNMGKKYSSPGLIADGKQHKVDVLATLVVFFGLFAQYLGFNLDSVAAVIVAGFIAYSGWDILKDSMKTLLDASIDYKTRDLIRTAIISDPMVMDIKDLTARNSGRFIFVEATVKMEKTNISVAHVASDRIESGIHLLVPNVERIVIHYEPGEKQQIRYVVPLEDYEGKLSPHFGEALYFAILDFDLKDSKLLRKETLKNPAGHMEKQKGIQFAKYLLKYKPDVVFSKHELSGKSAGYVFESAGILVRITEFDDLSEVVKEIEAELEDDTADSSG